MTSPVAIIGLTYDSTDLQDADLGLFLQIVHGLNETPEVRGTDWIVPGAAGRVPYPREADVLRIELGDGWVMGTGSTHGDQMADFRDTVKALRELFDPTRDPATLTALLENGDTATISARPQGASLIVNEVVPSLFAYVSVVLESVDPDWVFTPMGS